MTPPGSRDKSSAHPKTICTLLLASVLWACGALLPELLPLQFSGVLPQFAALALPLGLLAVSTGVLSFLRKTQWPSRQRLQSAVWIGLGLFTAPALLVHISAGWISGLERIALFTLVPVFSIVLEPYLTHPATRPIRGALPAALLAVLGTLLVFPANLPASITAALAITAIILAAACVAAASCYAVSVYRESELPLARPITAVAASSAALSLGLASLLVERSRWQTVAIAPTLLWAAAAELPALLLLFWLLPQLSAARISTCFALAPLIFVLLGALLMQLPLAPRTSLGLLWMAAGAGYLLFAPEADVAPTTLLDRPPFP
jgi:drug/metabolite transporter (DMT)-like permease